MRGRALRGSATYLRPETAGEPAACWCGQPPCVVLEPTDATGSGWVDAGGAFVPVYRCALHYGRGASLRSYRATILP